MHGIFPQARGVQTDRYTMEISVNRDFSLRSVLLYDNEADPYQMNNIPYKDHPELFSALCEALASKLQEADDIWHRDRIMQRLGLAAKP